MPSLEPQLSAKLRHRPDRRLTTLLLTGLAGLSGAARPLPLAAHDIPARVTVLTLVKPEGRTLRVLVRAPLEAMRDIHFPVRGPGYLDFERAGPLLRDAAVLWIAGGLSFAEAGRDLGQPRIVAYRVALPSDRSFERFESALATVTGPPLPSDTELVWTQALLDVLLEYPIAAGEDLAVRTEFARLGLETTTVLRFLPTGGGERAFRWQGDAGQVRLDPRWHHAALRFVGDGFRHILDGLDHLLFVLCLVIPFRRFRSLVVIITAFTLAHSITLVAATLGFAPQGLWFAPFIETLIALSILYMAFENILGAKAERRWALAFGFGLVHGFGFAFYLREGLQFAGGHLASSLLAFNLGVELGQLFVLLLAVPALSWLFRRIPERAGVILLSALVAHSAWHWMTERLTALRQYRLEWPRFDQALLSGLLGWLVVLALLAGAIRLLSRLYRRLGTPAQAEPAGDS